MTTTPILDDMPLPIDAVVGDVRAALAEKTRVVLVAPPGAGKTTRLPLKLVDEDWLAGKKIIMLEPRRLAARGAAQRMARSVGGEVGGLVGMRARLGTKVGRGTRIEVVTEGVFTRLILDDPMLEGVGLVIFDEFHERSLDADFGLALALDAQKGLRDDLRILVMSATLDGARIASILGDCPVIESAGRAYPVETRYLGRLASGRLEDDVTDAVVSALRSEKGSVLVFLPGQAEIRRTAERLEARIAALGLAGVDIAPLHGALDPAEQDRAVLPSRGGRRKVVLATSIAETSLTIEGVRIVVDSGVARVPRYEPELGVTRLVTQRVSRAAADQRRGRAGRTEPGVCLRLWDEPETMALPAFATPEILNADLAGLLLDCAFWGVTDPGLLPWLDKPPAAALEAARGHMTALGVLDPGGGLTAFGKAVRELPLPPHIAAMVLKAAEVGAERLAAEIAAVLVERGLGGTSLDLEVRVEGFRRERGPRAEQMRRMAESWAMAARKTPQAGTGGRADLSAAEVLALAYPGRVAKSRGTGGQFILANGRGGVIDPTEAMSRQPFIVVAEMQGAAAQTRILLAARLGEQALQRVAGGRLEDADEMSFDMAARAVRARRVRRFGAIVLDSAPRAVEAGPAATAALIGGIRSLGVSELPWSKAQMQLRARVGFVRDLVPGAWPDLSDDGLSAALEDWLAPFLDGKTRISDIGADDLGRALDALLPWALRSSLDEAAPTHFLAPTGMAHPIRYDGPGAPAISLRVQELFGLKEHPAIGNGRLGLTIEMLSPAHRPIQVTRDLPKFWAGSWRDVRADMRGQYPKHVWPEDPAHAQPTTRAKPRGS